jgi:hypothetical protein
MEVLIISGKWKGYYGKVINKGSYKSLIKRNSDGKTRLIRNDFFFRPKK